MRLLAVVFALTAAGPHAGAHLVAQAVTAGEIGGSVRSANGSPVDGARVIVANEATGFTAETEVREGRFLLQGLEIGGPYRVTARRIGFGPQRREGLYLTLGEPLELEFILRLAAIPLDAVRVVGIRPGEARGGTGTTIRDSILHRLPTLNRDLYDFVALAPQVSIGFGLSGGGVGMRLNNFMIQGVPERSLISNQPPEFAGGRSMPLSAVSEYQVLLSPFDVRYGDFAGALVNAVTRSGTNARHGTVFAYARNDVLAREGGTAGGVPYERLQAGFSIGGPLKRDRLHYFVASELQLLGSRGSGPYLGQPESAAPQVPVHEADLARLEEIMDTAYGLRAGSGGAVETGDDVASLFTRLDLALPEWHSRGVAWVNASGSRRRDFARPPAGAYPLSSTAAALHFRSRTVAVQLYTGLARAGGGQNELLVSHRTNWGDYRPDVRQPVIRVRTPGTTGGTVTVVTGTSLPAQASYSRTREIGVRDNLTLPLGRSHVGTVGVDASWFRIRGRSAMNTYGSWSFSSLSDLERGTADRYEIERDFGSADTPMDGSRFAVHGGDRWRIGPRIELTLGLRFDALVVQGRAPYNRAIDSIFGWRTDASIDPRVQLSPRVGAVWDVWGTGRDRVRGGVGLFAGGPPLGWLQSALVRHGTGVGLLRCGSTPSDLGPPPPFEPDHGSPPTTCGDEAGLTSAPAGDVDLIDPALRMVRTLRATIAYDRRLPWGMDATVEALVTRNVSDLRFENLNLRDPSAVDRHGRVLYGILLPGGESAPALRADSFPSVIALRNTSRNRSHQLAVRLEKRFTAGTSLTASYAFSRVRDVQTPLRINVPGEVNWSTGAPVSGRHGDSEPGVSLNDVPHRLVVAASFRTRSSRWATGISLLYIGESGRPFTYVAWGVGGRGDLNADGSAVNDPIYVPRSVYDTTEIRFSGAEERVSAQQAAFERFVEGEPCLDRQRGRIVERNSCRSPWSHTTVASIRQSVPLLGRGLEAQVDLFNVLNLLDRDWGLRREPGTGCGACETSWTRWTGSPALLEHVGQLALADGGAQSVFRFDETARHWQTMRPESAYQIQLGLRYQF